MKKLVLLGLCSVLTISLTAQVDSVKTSDNSETAKEVKEKNKVVSDPTDVSKKGKPDTTSIKVGEKEISIIEEDGETSIKIIDKSGDFDLHDDDSQIEIPEVPEAPEIPDIDDDSYKEKKFKGHWAGFEFGPNNYVDKDFSLSRSEESEFLDINTGKSWNFNLNFAQYSFPIAKDRFGLVTGMGIEWSNYHFENENTIQKLDGEIQPLPLTMNTEKNRLQTTYLTIPLLTEIQLLEGKRSNRLHFSAGVIGGIKLFSNTKVKYYDSGSKQKVKKKSDYYLSPLRYAVTARVGYKMVKLYFNYYLTPLFLEDRGPELYPVATGLAITF